MWRLCAGWIPTIRTGISGTAPGRGSSVKDPPQTLVWLIAVQHAGVLSVYLTFPLVVMREGGASVRDTMAILTLSLLAMGAATIVQSHRRLGSGLLCPVTFTAAYIGPSILAYRQGGLPLVFGMTVFAGCAEMAYLPIPSTTAGAVPPGNVGARSTPCRDRDRVLGSTPTAGPADRQCGSATLDDAARHIRDYDRTQRVGSATAEACRCPRRDYGRLCLRVFLGRLLRRRNCGNRVRAPARDPQDGPM